MTTPDAMTVVYTLTGPEPDLPGRPHHPGGLRGGRGHDPRRPPATPRPHRCPSAPDRSSTRSGSPTTTSPPPAIRTTGARGSPTSTPITFKPIPDTDPAGVDPPIRRGRHDRVGRPHHHHQLLRLGRSGYQLVDTRTGVIGQPTFSFIMLNTAVAPTNDLSIRQALAKGMNQAELQRLLGGPPAQPVERDLPARLPLLQQDRAIRPTTPPGPRAWSAATRPSTAPRPSNITTIPDPDRRSRWSRPSSRCGSRSDSTSPSPRCEQATIIDDFVLGKFQAATSYQFGAVDPDLNYVWWSTTTVSPPGKIGLNFTRLEDPQLETALLQGRHTTETVRPGVGLPDGQRAAGQGPGLPVDRAVLLLARWPQDRVQNFDNPDPARREAAATPSTKASSCRPRSG